jgi:hypothetical protein
MGPGTHVVERVKRGDPPRTLSDKVAQRHDIDYALAKSQADVVKADRRMVKRLKALEKAGADSKINTQLGMRGIQAKMIAERSGLVKPGKIASFGGTHQSDVPIMERKRKELEQQGFGVRPGDLLRMEIMESMEKAKKKKGRQQSGGRAPSRKMVKGKAQYGGRAPSASVSKSGAVIVGGAMSKPMMSTAKKIHSFITEKQLPMLFHDMSGMGLGLSGKGLRLAGQGIIKDISPTIMKIVLRCLSKQPLTGKGKFSRAMSKLVKTVKPIAGDVGKFMMPILIGIMKAKLEKKLKGSGRPETFAEVQRRINNPGLIAKLGGLLSDVLFKQLRAMLSKQLSGSGMSLAGGSFASFWKGFKKGFTDVFKVAGEVAKVAGPLVPLLL